MPASSGGPAIAFQFLRAKSASGLGYNVEYTADLAGSWTTAVHGANGITIVATPVDAETDRITATFPATSPKLFARLRL